jgi:hypothetical protein
MNKSLGFRITKEDTQLIRYLHSTKVATTSQIKRDIYTKLSGSNTRKRLKFLRDAKLVNTSRSADIKKTNFQYTLTNQGLDLFKKVFKKSLISNRINSDSIDHDLCLVEIRKVFSSLNMVKSYFTENQIQSYVELDEDKKYHTIKELNFDACVSIQKEDSDRFLIGIQFEQTQKQKNRYKSLIIDYYAQDNLPIIFYICSSKTIENKIKEIENEISDNEFKKIYFLSYSEMIQKQNELVFKNSKNQLIRVN